MATTQTTETMSNIDQLKKEMNEDYKLIPMMEIADEARLLAVAWVEGYDYQGMDIPGKQKLASDIMNYARRKSAKKDAEIERLKGLIEGEKEKRDEYFEIIKQLCFLKDMKDNMGKTEQYLKQQPLAWKEAFNAIEEQQ